MFSICEQEPRYCGSRVLGRPDMDLSDLLIFKTVAEEGGILRAARKLHRVQSNVTTRIKQLETRASIRGFGSTSAGCE
jgi:DNA-binding transcriptional LysR family regulator